ncbi:MAG: copper amine oxidase N-terminal domain-containing protein [Bacillota bacterium]
MPRRFSLFIIFIMVLALITINLQYISPAHAETRVDVLNQKKQLVKSVVFVIGLNQYYVNNQTPGIKMDARPFIKEGRTFVPVRYLGNALGVTDENIAWDGGLQKVSLTLGANSVEMVVGVPKITANGLAREIDVSPVLNDSEGRTYLPARYIAEGLGFEVDWDEATQTVLCWPRGEVKPEVDSVKQFIKELAGKPEAIRELEGMLGVVTEPFRSTWSYTPAWEKSTWDEATRQEAERNNGHSYFIFEYYPEDGGIIVAINWIRNLSDIRGVELDLSPIEKVLNWRFPNQPDKVREIMSYAGQVAEKTRASNRTERAPWKEYYLDGWKVSVGSLGGCFVEAIIAKEGS